MAKIRFVLVLALLVLVSTSLFASSRKTFYYNDATFSSIIGARYVPAWGCPETDIFWSWGYITSYQEIHSYSECDEGGTEIVRCFSNGTQVPCP